MAAKDYVFCKAALTGHIYLTRKIKSKDVMSQDRRLVEDHEAIGCFEVYLRRYCEKKIIPIRSMALTPKEKFSLHQP